MVARVPGYVTVTTLLLVFVGDNRNFLKDGVNIYLMAGFEIVMRHADT
jgi:hypothetical protein